MRASVYREIDLNLEPIDPGVTCRYDASRIGIDLTPLSVCLACFPMMYYRIGVCSIRNLYAGAESRIMGGAVTGFLQETQRTSE